MGVKVFGIARDNQIILRHTCEECGEILTDRFFSHEEKEIFSKCSSCRGKFDEPTKMLIRRKITED